MKFYLIPALKLSALFLVLCSVAYPVLIAGFARFAPGKGDGITLKKNGKTVGYENLGQAFRQPGYFHGRPSAVDYNAAGSAGSNKGPTNPDYLSSVRERIRNLQEVNPGVRKEEIPADLVTASGSGLDPHISEKGAKLQATRIARVRNLEVSSVLNLIDRFIEKPSIGLPGHGKINVLKLNLALDALEYSRPNAK